MGDSKPQAAADDIQTKVKADTPPDDAVRTQISTALTTNNVTSQSDFAAVSQQLEAKGVLPSILLDDKARGDLITKYGKDNALTKENLQAAVNNKDESPYNRLLAESLLRRFDLARQETGETGNRLTRDDLAKWAQKNATGTRDHLTYEQNAQTGTEIATDKGKVVAVTAADGSETRFIRDGNNNLTGIAGPSDSYSLTTSNGGYGFINDKNHRFGPGNQKGDVMSMIVTPPGVDDKTGEFKYEVNRGPGTDKLVVTHNKDNSEVAVDSQGRVQSVLYPDGRTMVFEYGSDPTKPTKIIESSPNHDNKPITYTPGEPGKPWTATPADGARQIIDPVMGKGADVGVLTYKDAAGVEHKLSLNGKDSGAPAPVETVPLRATEATKIPPEGVKLPSGDTIKVTTVKVNGEDQVATLTRTNVNGETETLTRNDDGSYSIQRKNKDGGTSNEKATSLTVSANGEYSYTTESGAIIKQNANGTREITDSQGKGGKTVLTFNEKGEATSIVHTGKGGPSETLTRGTNGEWQIQSPTAGGKVDNVKVNADGSYSYTKGNGVTVTQETTRNVREEKAADGSSIRTGFDKDGNLEFMQRNITLMEGNPPKAANHNEVVKKGPDGQLMIERDGQKVDAKDIKVYPTGGYEYTRADGARIYQDATTRRETLADKSVSTFTTNADGSHTNKWEGANGDTSTIKLNKDGNVVGVENYFKEGNRKETIVLDGSGKPQLTVTADGKPVEVKNFAPFPDGRYMYDVPMADGKMRHIDQEPNGHRVEFTTSDYKVVQGDTLQRLAERNKVTVEDILMANVGNQALIDRLKANNGALQPGETIRMPSDKVERPARAGGAGDLPDTPLNRKLAEYDNQPQIDKLQRGETLYAFAQRHLGKNATNKEIYTWLNEVMKASGFPDAKLDPNKTSYTPKDLPRAWNSISYKTELHLHGDEANQHRERERIATSMVPDAVSRIPGMTDEVRADLSKKLGHPVTDRDMQALVDNKLITAEQKAAFEKARDDEIAAAKEQVKKYEQARAARKAGPPARRDFYGYN